MQNTHTQKNSISKKSDGYPGYLATVPIQKESAIQAECFQCHWNNYPQERGQLFMVYNNAKNRNHGAILKAMGMVAGVSDMVLLRSGRVIFLECKRPGEKQSPDQIRFENLVRSLGFDYELFHSLEEFTSILKQYPANGARTPF